MATLARSAHQQFPHETLVPLSLALALVELGRVDEARNELSRWPAARHPDALSGARAVGAWAYLSDLAWAMPNAEQAPLLLALLHPYAGRHLTLAVVGASLGSTYRGLGQVAALLERWDDELAAFGWIAPRPDGAVLEESERSAAL